MTEEELAALKEAERVAAELEAEKLKALEIEKKKLEDENKLKAEQEAEKLKKEQEDKEKGNEEVLSDRIISLEKTILELKETSEKNQAEKEAEKKEIQDKYEAKVYEESGTDDIDYLKYLANKKIDMGKTLEESLKEIKEEKPTLFISERKGQGKKPNGNGSGKIPYEEYLTLSKAERIKAVNEKRVEF